MDRMRPITLVLLLLPILQAQSNSTNSSRFDASSLDTSVEPCVDFYQFTCGTWIAKNPIPPDQPVWGRFDELAERNRTTLRDILEQSAAEDPKRSAIEQKIGDYYASCMDEKGIEAKGVAPLRPELDRIARLPSKAALVDEVIRL